MKTSILHHNFNKSGALLIALLITGTHIEEAKPDGRKGGDSTSKLPRIYPLKVVRVGKKRHIDGSPFVNSLGLGRNNAWGFKMHTELRLFDNQKPSPNLYTKGTIREDLQILRGYGPIDPRTGQPLTTADYLLNDQGEAMFPDVVVAEGHNGEITDENALAFGNLTRGNKDDLWVTMLQTFFIEQAPSAAYRVPSYVFPRSTPGRRELNYHILAYHQGYYNRSHDQ